MLILLAAVVAYGAFLRCDALFARFGPFDRPAWLVSLQHVVSSSRGALVPDGWNWEKSSIGGDPVSYLRFAREMRSFYQAHLREPVFVAATRVWLRIADGEDVAVSLSSLSFSILVIVAAYLLGAAVVSPWTGLAAATVLAIDRDMVSWAPEGWRDGAFTAMVCLSAWAIVRLWRRRNWRAAVLVGILGGFACLTRITALSFLVPAIAVTALPETRKRWRITTAQAAVAAVVMAAIAAPYVINCYRVFGDPFYAINFHTHFYRSRAGVAYQADQTALGYVAERFASRPIAAIDTAVRGLVAYPLTIKWHGLDMWVSGLATVLEWLAALGLFVWLWQPLGRLLLVILLGSLAPYMMTWSIPGGGEWRFTMHAYPFYLVAAFGVIELAVRTARQFSVADLRAGRVSPARRRAFALRMTVLCVGGVVAWGWAFWSPLLVAREAVNAGDEVNIQAGPGDRVFFRRGWSDLVSTGAVTARFAVARQSVLYVTLPRSRPYRVTLRVDPVPSNLGQRVQVLLEGQPVESLALAWDPERVGTYDVDVPARLAGRNLARLTLVADRVLPAGDAAALYPGIHASQPVAFRLWYARIHPL